MCVGDVVGEVEEKMDAFRNGSVVRRGGVGVAEMGGRGGMLCEYWQQLKDGVRRLLAHGARAWHGGMVRIGDAAVFDQVGYIETRAVAYHDQLVPDPASESEAAEDALTVGDVLLPLSGSPSPPADTPHASRVIWRARPGRGPPAFGEGRACRMAALVSEKPVMMMATKRLKSMKLPMTVRKTK